MAWTCSDCGLVREKPEKRIPGGWKKIPAHEARLEALYCHACLLKHYSLRAITIPVASPLDCDWKQLDAKLASMWQMTTQMSNWIMTQLFSRDTKRVNTTDKLAPMPRIYLYPELRVMWPQMPSQCVASLEQSLQKKYRALRRFVIGNYSKSLPSMRYPTPFPIPAQGWSVMIDNQCPVVSVRIGDSRMKLRLRGGFRYRRQLGAVKEMISGSAMTGELAIFRNRDEILVKLVAWLPRSAQKKRDGDLMVRTSKESLLCALNAKDEVLWNYNANHLLKWQDEHRRRLHRWSEDQKYEQRPVPTFAAWRDIMVERQRDRMDTACHQIAAQLVGYAVRRNFAQLIYDDSDTSFAPEFMYFKLRQLIEEKANYEGIIFVHANQATSDIKSESLPKTATE